MQKIAICFILFEMSSQLQDSNTRWA